MDSSKLFTEEEIKNILDKDILELMGAQNMPQEKKTELYEKMAKTVQDRVVARIDDKLDEPSRQEFVKLIEEGDSKKVEEYLRSKDIEVSKLLVEEAIIYKTEIMSLYKQGQSTDKE